MLPSLTLIASRDTNGVIGREGKLPWRLRDDLRWFKRVTFDHVVVMGRKTWEGLPYRPLRNRYNIVISKQYFQVPSGELCQTVEKAIERASEVSRIMGRDEYFGIGGESIYKQLISKASSMLVTEVNTNTEGDATFPLFSRSRWSKHLLNTVKADKNNEYDFSIYRYTRDI